MVPATDWRTALGLERYVALDLETTGLDPEKCEIIEVGVVLFQSGEPIERFQSLVRPAGALDYFITELTGIRDADLAEAPKFDEVKSELLGFVSDLPVVGQHVDFDLGFLSAHGGSDFRFLDRTVLDTAMLARIFWPELPRFSLSALCQTFRTELTEAHRAAADAEACGRVLDAMLRQLPARVWQRLAADLNYLIAPTRHRSAAFFFALANVTEGIAAPEQAEPSGEEVTSEQVRDPVQLLARGGACAETLPSFVPRPEQLEMSKLVHGALMDPQILVLEAPTGVGKSLAYLTPALAWAMEEEEEDARQVVISSHTRALQEQLHKKDLADLETALRARIPAAVLKGRRNYLCRRRFKSVVADAEARLSDADRLKLMQLVRWSQLTTSGDIGEIGAFSPEHDPALWSQLASDSVACSGALCGVHQGDFYRLATERAARARLLFVNHALLTTDCARFLNGESGTRRLIIDEAHQLERAAVSAATAEFSLSVLRAAFSRFTDERSARGLLARIAKDLPTADVMLRRQVSDLDRAIKNLYRAAREHVTVAAALIPPESNSFARRRLRSGEPLLNRLAETLAPLLAEIASVCDDADQLGRALANRFENERTERERLSELKAALDQLQEVLNIGRETLEAGEPSRVVWADVFGLRTVPQVALFSAPVDVGAHLSRELWPRVEGAVLTSATLRSAESFDHFTAALGLSSLAESRVSTAHLPTPFDLPRQMRIMCPTYLPDTKASAQHLAAVGDLLAAVLRGEPRGTLVLCTSNAAAEELFKRAQHVARAQNRVCLHQTSAGRIPELVKSFRKARNGILIGSMGLWEGIDVVGEALEILIVVRLPFDVPSEPWVEARSEVTANSGRDPFYEFSLPVCSIRLRQGIGRLIRNAQDRGVVIITDSRLAKTRYGRVLQQSLPVPVEQVASVESLTEGLRNFFESA